MKRLFFCVALLAMSVDLSFAQTKVLIDSIVNVTRQNDNVLLNTNAPPKVAFDCTEIVYLNLSKNELWSNLKSWVSSSFASRFVIEDEDKEMGRLTVKYNKQEDYLGLTVSGILNSSLQIDVRDGKYRIHFFNQNVEVKVKNQSYDYLPANTLKTLREELVEVESTAKRYFNSSMTWYLERIAENRDIKESVVNNAITRMSYMNYNIRSSLQEAMSIKDDF